MPYPIPGIESPHCGPDLVVQIRVTLQQRLMHPQPVLRPDGSAAIEQLAGDPGHFVVAQTQPAAPEPKSQSGGRPQPWYRLGSSGGKNHRADMAGMTARQFLDDHSTHRVSEHSSPRDTHRIEQTRKVVGEIGDLDWAAHPIALAVVAKVGDYHPVALCQQRHNAVESHGAVEIPAVDQYKHLRVGITRLPNEHFVLTNEKSAAGYRQRVGLRMRKAWCQIRTEQAPGQPAGSGETSDSTQPQLLIPGWRAIESQRVNGKDMIGNRHSPDEMFDDDPFHNRFVDRVVPDALRIDDCDRSPFADPEAIDFGAQDRTSGGSDGGRRDIEVTTAPWRRRGRNAECLQASLQIGPHHRALLVCGTARCPLLRAEENVTIKASDPERASNRVKTPLYVVIHRSTKVAARAKPKSDSTAPYDRFVDWKQHFARIYQNEPEKYQRLVAAEDRTGELASRVEELATAGSRIVDIGAGTGRLTLGLCRPGNEIHGIDKEAAMLDIARGRLEACGGQWQLSVADARELPIATGWADAAIAGWVFGHFTEWHPDDWEQELDKAIAEMDRVVRPEGIEVVIDTLGTGTTEPKAPNQALAEYHLRLEDRGFERTVLRTDYEFDSVEESIELLDWFFGLGDWARRHNNKRIPEYTGWWERTTSNQARGG